MVVGGKDFLGSNRSKSITAWMKKILYFGLLGYACLLLYETVKSYMEGNIAQETKYSHITIKDLPTIVFCLVYPREAIYGHKEMVLGKDFSINIKVREKGEKAVTLVENRVIKASPGLEFYLSRFWLSRYLQNNTHADYGLEYGPYINLNVQCYKVTTGWDGNKTLDFNLFRLEWTLNLLTGVIDIGLLKVNVSLASEKNSFGLATGKWYEGDIEKPSATLLPYFFAELEIEVLERNFIECSQVSYYECLAKRFAEHNFSRSSNIIMHNGTRCNFTVQCSPISCRNPYADLQVRNTKSLS